MMLMLIIASFLFVNVASAGTIVWDWTPASSNCGPAHYPDVVDADWGTSETISLGDVLYFNYTSYPLAYAVFWHVGYWAFEGEGHINESIAIPQEIVDACDGLLYLKVEVVAGPWWGNNYNFSAWNNETDEWTLLLHAGGGMDGEFYDTQMEWDPDPPVIPPSEESTNYITGTVIPLLIGIVIISMFVGLMATVGPTKEVMITMLIVSILGVVGIHVITTL